MNFLQYLLVIGGSALLSAVAVAASIRLAHRVGAFDHPDSERKIQERPIPKLGGVAVALAFSVAVIFILAATGRFGQLSLALSVLLPALGAALLGYLDDIRELNPWVRLTAQLGLAFLAWWAGTSINVTSNTVIDAILTVLWIVVIVNGINLLDNSDGLAGTTILVSSAAAGVVALINGQTLVSLMAFAMTGIALGFLKFNWFPARVYLGDAGAYFLGFMLALLAIRLRPAGAPEFTAIIIAILIALLPLVDTTFVVTRRLSAGVHPFTAGRDHLSHLLQGRGITVAGSVLTLNALLLISSLLAVALAWLYS